MFSRDSEKLGHFVNVFFREPFPLYGTDCGKTRLLLESMWGGLKIGETETFEKFLGGNV